MTFQFRKSQIRAPESPDHLDKTEESNRESVLKTLQPMGLNVQVILLDYTGKI